MKSFLTLSLCLFALLGSSAHAQEAQNPVEPTDDVYMPSDCAAPTDTFNVKSGGDKAIGKKANAIAYALASQAWADLKKDESLDGSKVVGVHLSSTKKGYQIGVSLTESQLSFGSQGGTQNTPQTALLEVEVDSQGKLGKVTGYFARAYASPSFIH